MKTIYGLMLGLILNLSAVQAQNALSYTNENGEQHLAGPIGINDFKSDTTYAKWYSKGYDAFDLKEKKPKWSKNLKNTQVNIYMGTWCGDSQEWVPQFVKLWEQLGLDSDQVNIIALYDTDEQYKQGPNGEEKGLNIHRVPTFIFKKEGEEYARIVESPSTDLETDVAQIALGYPSAPNYAAANYLLGVFDELNMTDINNDINKIFRSTYYKVGRYTELNTLANVLMAANKKEEALFTFQFNTYIYPGNWYTHYKLAEANEKLENYEVALKGYEQVIVLKPEHEDSKNAIEKLQKLIAEESTSDSPSENDSNTDEG